MRCPAGPARLLPGRPGRDDLRVPDAMFPSWPRSCMRPGRPPDVRRAVGRRVRGEPAQRLDGRISGGTALAIALPRPAGVSRSPGLAWRPRSGWHSAAWSGRRRGHGQRDLPSTLWNRRSPTSCADGWPASSCSATVSGRRPPAAFRLAPAGRVRVSLVSAGSPASGRSHWVCALLPPFTRTVPRPLSWSPGRRSHTRLTHG